MATSKKGGGSSGTKNNRGAVTGKYVTDKYAKSHPKTTVSESRPDPSPPGKKGKS